jgi:predicted O-linked N-acetylglucosamine transferase (SPINDLY family)
VNNFKYLTGKIENMASQILGDNLDILIFPDIGLSPKVQVLSAMRLAPIQCSAWGHPITSGSPNIDYFLSSELMEPNNTDEHYTETLIKLPNLGFSVIEPAIPKLTKHRSDFQIPENSIIYLCCQSIFKYLPIFDDVFPKIVQRNPQAYFVLIDTHPTMGIIKYLKERLRIAFRRYELNYEEWFIFIPALSFEEYLMVLQLSDIFLDTFAWSGGISSIDAITCGLPIVTCSGEMMRSRQSYGMLNMIGVTETIAKNEANYIEIAVRLGQDSQWRQSVIDKMQANKYKLFNDKNCIVALEKFFEQAIAKKIEDDNVDGNE